MTTCSEYDSPFRVDWVICNSLFLLCLAVVKCLRIGKTYSLGEYEMIRTKYIIFC